MQRVLNLKKTVFLLFLLIWQPVGDTNAQELKKIELSDVSVSVKGNVAGGIAGEHLVLPGKTSPPYQLYVSDSLTVTVTFKLTAGSSRRSNLKDSSVKLAIGYSVLYKGYGNDKRVDRIFYLDEARKFAEKETFNLAMGKYDNTVIRVAFTGHLP
ncbi:MAG: hypothetical protein RL213_181 [Bacteroidota bacterium]|jgi:hypothetical protein